MTPLEKIIHSEIALNGPMTLGRYMSVCLSQYYGARDPLGAAGDFTTAPEVSQLFGEMIGAWLADTWMRLGAPQKFLLVEAGPGRGTLMSDIWRATKRVPGFHEGAEIHLIETSPALKEKQRATISHELIRWHDSMETIPDDAPLLFIANEFLDALPIEQLQYEGGKWLQRVVTTGENNSLQIGLKFPDAPLVSSCNKLTLSPREGDIFEVSSAGNMFIEQLSFRIKKQEGAGLFIDYGYAKNSFGDTLQALQKHKSVSIFHEPGQSDLTAHVNFAHVAAQIGAMGLHASKIVRQGTFLKTLGIETRLTVLLDQADAKQSDDLKTGYERLVADEHMGKLFKVLGFWSGNVELAGF